jgi:putative peptidoglycan lipid II flippase
VKTAGIFALAAGAVVGAVTQLIILLWGLRREGLTYRFIFAPRDPAIRHIFHLVYPFILSVLVTQAAGITYRVLVSDLPAGSLAALKFSEKITQLLTVIFLTSVTAVIYPLLSRKAAERNFIGMRETIASSLRLITFVTVPIIAGVVLLREPLIMFLFQRGSFTADDTLLTSAALLYLVLGLTVNGFSSVLGHATLALQETRASVAVSIASHVIAIFLFVLLVPQLAHAGLALASSLVPIIIALLYYLYLTRYIPDLKLIFWHRTYVQTFLLTAVLVATVAALRPFVARLTDYAALSAFFQLVLPAAAGSLVFFGGAYLWGIPEMHDVLAIVRHKLKKQSV